MRRSITVFVLIFSALLFAQMRERFAPVSLETNGGSAAWSIAGTADDTSEVFDMFSYQSIQYRFANDDDSTAYKVELYTTNKLLTTPTNAFQLSQTLTSSITDTGWQAPRQFFTPVARKGFIVVTGLTGNAALGSTGEIELLGQSNADNMSGRLR